MEFRIKNEFLELVVASRGAEKMTLVSNQGMHYLRTADAVWDSVSPFLFPNVGRLKEGKTRINNTWYHLPLHGFLRNQEFDILQQKKDEMTLVQVYNEATLKQFPFKYKVQITYSLKEKTLATSINIVNEDEHMMPFNLGGHPGFRCPLYDHETFSDYRIVFEKSETFNAPKVNPFGLLDFTTFGHSYQGLSELPLTYDYFKNDAMVIPRVRSKQVKLLNKENKGILFSYPEFISLAFWTKPNAGFLCLEPWIGYADLADSEQNFIKKDNIVMLAPLDTFQAKYNITIID